MGEVKPGGIFCCCCCCFLNLNILSTNSKWGGRIALKRFLQFYTAGTLYLSIILKLERAWQEDDF
jgi:hypothetical protein